MSAWSDFFIVRPASPRRDPAPGLLSVQCSGLTLPFAIERRRILDLAKDE
jgi:hypothetical protein